MFQPWTVAIAVALASNVAAAQSAPPPPARYTPTRNTPAGNTPAENTPAENTPTKTIPAQTVAVMDRLFAGPHPGARAVHARGLLCRGTFTPDPAAPALSRAPHLAGPPVPILVRFSNYPGDPAVPDNDPLAGPRGMAIKFLGPDETDIVALAYDGFPAATPEAFLAFMQAVASGNLDAPALRTPAAARFLAAPKPAPTSYATETFYGVSAFIFTNAENTARPAATASAPPPAPPT